MLVIDDGSPDNGRDRQRRRKEVSTSWNGPGNVAAGLAGFRWGTGGTDSTTSAEMDCEKRSGAPLPRRRRNDVVVGSVQGVNVVNWPMSRLLMSTSPRCTCVSRHAHAAARRHRRIRLLLAPGAGDDRPRRRPHEGLRVPDRDEILGLAVRNAAQGVVIFVERREGTSFFGEAFFGVLKLPFRRIRKRK